MRLKTPIPALAVALLSLATGITLSFAQSPGQDPNNPWNQWRGPNQAGVTRVAPLPVTWDDGDKILWKTELPGPGGSQPVLWNGRIYVTSFSGYSPGGRQIKISDGGVPAEGLKLHVTCVDASNGEILGNIDLEPMHPINQGSKNVAYHGFATPTPYLDAERLYVSFGNGGVYCFDHGGNELWRTSIGTDSPDWGYAASVVGFEDLLIVNASVESGAVLGLDKKTGEEVWRNEEGVGQGMNEISRSTPLIFKNAQGQWRMALMVAGQFLQVYDPTTGEVLWKEGRYSGGYASNTPVPNEAGSVLYCFFGGSHGTTEAAAFRTGDGVEERKIWQVEHVGHGLVPPVLYQGRLYYGAYGGVKPAPAQGFGCLDAETGEKIFHVQPEEFKDNVYSPALAGDGKIYLQTQLSGVWVLDAGTEFEVLAKNVLDEDQVATKMNMAERQTGNTSGNGYIAMPVPLGDGRLLLRGFWGLHCVEAPR